MYDSFVKHILYRVICALQGCFEKQPWPNGLPCIKFPLSYTHLPKYISVVFGDWRDNETQPS